MVDIDRNSPAAGFGFLPRDIVREVNGEVIDTADKLRQVAEQPSRWWRFTVERDGSCCARCSGMSRIPKSGNRFLSKIMPGKKAEQHSDIVMAPLL